MRHNLVRDNILKMKSLRIYRILGDCFILLIKTIKVASDRIRRKDNGI